jgi:hypothetical protein
MILSYQSKEQGIAQTDDLPSAAAEICGYERVGGQDFFQRGRSNFPKGEAVYKFACKLTFKQYKAICIDRPTAVVLRLLVLACGSYLI